MAASQLGRRAAIPALLLGSGLVLTPRTTLHAESPSSSSSSRKPIYDDDIPIRNTAPVPSAPLEPSPLASQESSLTSQLATYVRGARVFTAVHVRLAEDRFNDVAQRFFNLEHSVTSTVAALAPPPETGEKVLPGALYVLVAGMAGQIVARRRNVLLRATVPVVLAVAAGRYLLPHTSKNVGDLVWSWEQKVPVVADNHLRVQGFVRQGWKEVGTRTRDARAELDNAVRRAREAAEEWIQKGK